MTVECLFFFVYILGTFQQNIITTFAGVGTAGTTGNGGLPTLATLNSPHSIYVRSNGVYFTEYSGNVIRLVDTSSNTITTYSGGGSNAGNNILRTNAILTNPFAILEYNDYLYLTERGAHKIRRISMSSGTIEAYAGAGDGYNGDGGLAISALFYYPGAMYIYGNYFYICDTDNFVIRRIDITTGTIYKYAGDHTNTYGGDGGDATSASIAQVYYIYIDSSYVWMTSYGNHRIRYISQSSNTIATFAGTGSGTYGGDGGNRLSASFGNLFGITIYGNYLYVSDGDKYRIRRINLLTSIVTTFVGTGTSGSSGDGGYATSAQIFEPRGLFIGYLHLWFGDSSNNKIRRVLMSTPSLWGDPHFVGLSGGKYTIDLLPDHCYLIFSSLLFRWISCAVQTGHRSSTYMGNTTFLIEGHKVKIPLRKSTINVIIDNTTYSGYGKFIRIGKLSSIRMSTRNSVYFKTPCLGISIRLCMKIVKTNKKDGGSVYRHHNHFDFSIIKTQHSHIGCDGSNGLLGITWNKTARPFGRHGEGIIVGKLSDYEV